MSRLLLVTDAARQLGVHQQTIRNWAEKGVLTIKKIGKAHFVDADLIEQIGDFASDLERAKKTLESLKQQIHEETYKERLARYDHVNYRRFTNLCVEASIRSDFFQIVLQLLTDYGLLCDREMQILSKRLAGESLEEISNEYGLTRERVRQIAERAIRKSHDLTELKKKIEEMDTLKVNVEAMKVEIQHLREQLHIKEESERILNDEEFKKRVLEKDPILKLLSTKVVDCELSVRSLNVLKSYRDCEGFKDIDTVGDLCRIHVADLLKQRNFGKKSLTEIKKFLSDHGLHLGMDVDKLYRERTKYLMMTDK